MRRNVVKLGKISSNLVRGIVDNNREPTKHMRWMPTA